MSRYLRPMAMLAAVSGLICLPLASNRSIRHTETAAGDSESPLCSMPASGGPPWLPTTPVPQETTVPDPRPASDCGFYRPAWQRFLVATQPTPDGPAFLSYPSFDEIFAPAPMTLDQLSRRRPLELSLTPRNVQRRNAPT